MRLALGGQAEHGQGDPPAGAVLAEQLEGAALAELAEVLGVGAGNEATCFVLTREVRRVFATDLYLAEGWEESANSSMLTDPQRHWPDDWNERRLVVQHMNALDLQYEDRSMDAVFSSSSFARAVSTTARRSSSSSITRSTICAWVATAYGSSPCRPRRRRSGRVNAIDR